MPVLNLRDVTKTYRLGETEVQTLRGVDLEIEKGEVLAIMGPSGSGKSTVMHIFGLLDTPTSGEAAIEGTGVSTLTERKRAGLRGKRIGFVFQTFNLVETLTAQGNVELPMIFQGGEAGCPREVRRGHPDEGWSPRPDPPPAEPALGRGAPALWRTTRRSSLPTSRPGTWTRRAGSGSSNSWPIWRAAMRRRSSSYAQPRRGGNRRPRRHSQGREDHP